MISGARMPFETRFVVPIILSKCLTLRLRLYPAAAPRVKPAPRPNEIPGSEIFSDDTPVAILAMTEMALNVALKPLLFFN